MKGASLFEMLSALNETVLANQKGSYLVRTFSKASEEISAHRQDMLIRKKATAAKNKNIAEKIRHGARLTDHKINL